MSLPVIPLSISEQNDPQPDFHTFFKKLGIGADIISYRSRRMAPSLCMYFEPWDWIIIAGAYSYELEAVVHQVDTFNDKKEMSQIAIMIAVLAVCSIVWNLVAKNMTVPLVKGVKISEVTRASGEISDGSGKISMSAESLNQLANQFQEMVSYFSHIKKAEPVGPAIIIVRCRF